MELLNLSPYAAERLPIIAPDGEERLLVVVKATLDVSAPSPQLAPEQDPVRLADEWTGEPGTSSVRWPSDLVAFKPATDVVVTGSAYAGGRDRAAVDVRLRVGPVDKVVRVFGERRWIRSVGGVVRSPPVAFERVPLLWERAFGGMDETGGGLELEPANPAGVGFRARRSKKPIDGAPLPNLEDPGAPLHRPDDRPPPAGFGFVATHWAPRARHAGTYDERWAKERCPLLPDDFDLRYHQTAPADQILPAHLAGGEKVLLENASPSGRLAFVVPALPLDVSLKLGDAVLPIPMRADTLVIDGDRQTALIAWRGSVGVHDRVHGVEWIRVAEGA